MNRFAIGQDAYGRTYDYNPRTGGCPPGHTPTGCAPSGAGCPPGCGAGPAGGYDPTVYQVQDNYGTAARRWTLGFVSLAVAAAAQVNVVANPQHLFRPERLVIPSHVGVDFTVDQILIGNRPQSVAAGALTAVAFSEVAVGVGALFDSVEPGVTVTLTVTNTDAVNAHDFYATFFGATVAGTP